MAFHFNQGDRPLPGYTIQRGVGSGGFGEVYYAVSDGGKEIALKYLRDNPQVELRGATHCLNLKSPYLVALHDIKQNAEGESFVIMEYVNGPSLRDLMNDAQTQESAPQPPAEAGGLGPQKAAYFLREIAKGLAYLHDRGIVHRDLKPGNIFYEDGYVKIGDYGLAKIMAASQHSGQTMSVGTVHYMAPEVGSGNYDRTIDIYALGVMLYEMLLGRVPFSGASMGEVLMKHLTAQPEVDELPAPFPAVIRKALAKDPKDRYQTVTEMMNEVFAVEDINRSVATMDSLSLTRMAAAVGQKVKLGAGGGGRFGSGSSGAPTLDAGAVGRPAVADRGRVPVPPYATRRYPFWEDFKERPFGMKPAVGFPQRTRMATGLLGLALGPWGIHRFYTGHNAIGVYQILATCLTGVGALWGIIEGIQILLNGDFRDSMGRPLLEGRTASAPGARSKVARVLWTIPGILFLLAAIGLTIGATLAPPEIERVDWRIEGTRYYIDILNFMYFGAAAAFGLGAFAIWKAAHRGGLGVYRATIRPGLMCLCLTTLGMAFTAERLLFAGPTQIIGLIVMGFAAISFTLIWMLRGPRMVRLPGDLYWNRAWAGIFLVTGLIAGFGGLKTFGDWRRAGSPFYLKDAETFRTITVEESSRYSYDRESNTYSVPAVKFDHQPVASALLMLLAIGSLAEMRFRWRQVRLADVKPIQNARRGEANDHAGDPS